MYGRRDSAVLMTTALALLMMAGTWGQPTADNAASASPETAASDQPAADDNSVDSTATAFSRPFNGSDESLKKVRIHILSTFPRQKCPSFYRFLEEQNNCFISF